MANTNEMGSIVAKQKEVFEKLFTEEGSDWVHDTTDPLVRYLRDRRMALGLRRLSKHLAKPFGDMHALVVCGGSGGEATYLRKMGFGKVTNTDFSEAALETCRRRDPELETRWLNAEQMDLADESYDLVLVQDGLHHLPRPALGFNEMLRVARHAAMVIEPRYGLAGRILGREWEELCGTTNYVFRWTGSLLEQLTRSQLLKRPATVDVLDHWDHSDVIHKVASKFGPAGLLVAKSMYGVLTPFGWCGNSFVGLVVKQDR